MYTLFIIKRYTYSSAGYRVFHREGNSLQMDIFLEAINFIQIMITNDFYKALLRIWWCFRKVYVSICA